MIRSFKNFKLLETVEVFVNADFEDSNTLQQIIEGGAKNVNEQLAYAIGEKLSQIFGENGFETIKIEVHEDKSTPLGLKIYMLIAGKKHDYFFMFNSVHLVLRALKKGKFTADNLPSLNDKALDEIAYNLGNYIKRENIKQIVGGHKSEYLKISNIVDHLKEAEANDF